MARPVKIGSKDSAKFVDKAGKTHVYTPVVRDDGVEVCAMSNQPIAHSARPEVVDGFLYGTESKVYALEKQLANPTLRNVDLRNAVHADFIVRMRTTTVTGMKKAIPGFTTSSEKDQRLAGIREKILALQSQGKKS